MKSLITLIKLAKQELDRLRREMAELERKQDEFLQMKAFLTKQLLDERELAQHKPEMAVYYGHFAGQHQKKQEQINEELALLEREKEGQQEKIRTQFSQLKTYEIALDQWKQRQKAAAAQKETLMLDEIASQQYMRKMTE